MDTAVPQKFPYILDRNLAKANCTENQVCTSCDIVVVDYNIYDNRVLCYKIHMNFINVQLFLKCSVLILCAI